jgi:hypothetical protein
MGDERRMKRTKNFATEDANCFFPSLSYLHTRCLTGEGVKLEAQRALEKLNRREK